VSRSRSGGRAVGGDRGGRLAGRAHQELDLDAVADDPRERLGDQGAVARLEPILGETIWDRDLEVVVVHVDEDRVAEPGFEVGRRQRDLKLS